MELPVHFLWGSILWGPPTSGVIIVFLCEKQPYYIGYIKDLPKEVVYIFAVLSLNRTHIFILAIPPYGQPYHVLNFLSIQIGFHFEGKHYY